MGTTTQSSTATRALALVFFVGASWAVPSLAHAAPMSIYGPSSSSSGVYTLSWDPGSGGETMGAGEETMSVPTDEVAYVQEYRPGGSWTTIYTGTGTSITLTRLTGGNYMYRGMSCSPLYGCIEWGTAKTIVVTRPPGTPTLILDTTSDSGFYTVSWTPPTSSEVDYYELLTNVDGGTWSGLETSSSARLGRDEHKTQDGRYGYLVRACNSYGCGSYAHKTILVDLQVDAVIADAPVVNLPVPEQQNVGAIEAESGVDGGAGQYSIPIKVAPGRLNMQPQVSLNYNSRSGNGIAGVGWSLSGSSRIHRCPQTVAQDGQIRAVNFGLGDRLCLNGRRLVVVSGSYGFSGSEYRTEIEQFARVTLLNGNMNSPDSYFKVEHKNGRVSHYGAFTRTSSVQIPLGQSAPLSWMLDIVEDRQENSIQYVYWQSHGRVYLTDMYYTGATVVGLRVPGDRRVKLSYEWRPDKYTAFLAGSQTRTTYRLAAITTNSGSQLVRRYQLTYSTSGATGRSLLAQIQESADGLALLPTRFTYQDNPPSFFGRNSVLGLSGEQFRIRLTGDFDGDGQRDKLVLEYPDVLGGIPIREELRLSSGTTIDLSNQPWIAGFDGTDTDNPNSLDSDFDGDGRADLVGKINNRIAIAKWNGQGFDTIQSDYSTAATLFDMRGDFNGDGRSDLLLQVDRQLSLAMQCGAPVGLRFCQVSIGELAYGERVFQVADFDGNGLHDLYVDWNGYGNPTDGRIVFSYPQSNHGVRFEWRTLASIGGPISLKTGDVLGGFFEANGDSLQDIYRFSDRFSDGGGMKIYINRGDGSFVKSAILGTIDVAPRVDTAAFIMDYDNDGRDDLMVPVGTPVHDFCLTNPSTELFDCGENNWKAGLSKTLNHNIHAWDVVKFVYSGDGFLGYMHVVQSPTPLTLPVYNSYAEEEGDGISDVRYRLEQLWAAGRHGSWPYGHYSPLISSLGEKVVTGKGANAAADGGASDLMASATDGLGRVSTWEYRPLSSDGSPNCPRYPDRPYYQADYARARDGVHYFFTSTMHVAARLARSNGIGGMNASCYRYENAIFNSEGRGFLGFEAIIVEQDLPEHPEHNLRTTTYFHQQFPLVGRVSGTRTELTSDPLPTLTNDKPLSQSTRVWHADCRSNRTCFPYVEQETSETRDLITREVLSTVTRTMTYDPADLAYGNLTSAVVVTDDPTMTHTVRSQHVYDYADVATWWLNKQTQSTTASEAVVVKSAPFPSATENHAKTVVTATTWYPESSASARLLASTTVQPGDPNEQSRTVITAYDSHGNPTTITQSAAQLSTPRTTQLGYTSDGYFVASTTNPLGQVSTTVTDPESGQPFSQTLYGVTTTRSYDDLHRPTSVDSDGAPIAYHRLLWCDHSCPPNAVWRLQSIQDGSPVTTQYMDPLDRPIKTTATAFDGSETTVVTEYNARGQTVRTSAPSSAPDGAYFTEFSGFDALGRVGQKVVDRQGHAFATFTTNYSYHGLRTRIDLPAALTAWRSYNSRKQLVSTTDTAGNQSHFRQDGLGNQILIEDSAGNQTRFRFNHVGHRTWISDPDQGESHFVHNGLGELIEQTDANGDTLSFYYDQLGRMTARYLNGIAESAWSYDQIRAGTLHSESNFAGLTRTYSYDDLLRPTLTTTTTGGMEFVVEQVYDGYYGRPKGIRYPSGEMVEFTYNAHGYATGEQNPLDPTQPLLAYRTVKAMDARGNITEQQFGNGLTTYNEYYPSTGRPKSIYIPAPATDPTDPNPSPPPDPNEPAPYLTGAEPIQHLNYAYDDPFANLTEQQNVAQGVTETFLYDNLQRLTQSSRTWALDSEVVHYRYDALGNITRKDDYAQSYQYGTSGKANSAQAGPHAMVGYTPPVGTAVTDFSYDANGNQLTGDGRTITYNAFNKPLTIDRGGVTTSFAYGPDLARFRRVSPNDETTYYVGKLHEYVSKNGVIEERDYLGNYLVITHDGSTRSLSYVHTDRLGSTDVITDERGLVVESHGYDPFGKPRDGTWGDSNGGLLSSSVGHRGFTSHEHVDEQQLIHMNGRVYDYNLGRFLSVDPFIQNIANTQALNPYSYVLNNPLMATDPTGYACEDGDGVDCRPSVDASGENEQAAAIPKDDNGAMGQGPRQQGRRQPTLVIYVADVSQILYKKGKATDYGEALEKEIHRQLGPAAAKAGVILKVVLAKNFDRAASYEGAGSRVFPVVAARGSGGRAVKKLQEGLAKLSAMGKNKGARVEGAKSHLTRGARKLRDSWSSERQLQLGDESKVGGFHTPGEPGVAFINVTQNRKDNFYNKTAIGNVGVHEIAHGLGWSNKRGRKHGIGLMSATVNTFVKQDLFNRAQRDRAAQGIRRIMGREL